LKLNQDLVRLLLLQIEDKTGPYEPLELSDISIKDYSYEEILYTTERLLEAGYIKARLKTTDLHRNQVIYSLTWDGHKFLDTVRDNVVWRRTNDIVKKLSSVSLSLILHIGEQVILDMVRTGC
jgi:DNA-binding PadR family transcriptional regulator